MPRYTRTASAVRARIDAVVASGKVNRRSAECPQSARRPGFETRRFICRLCERERHENRPARNGVCLVCRVAMRDIFTGGNRGPIC